MQRLGATHVIDTEEVSFRLNVSACGRAGLPSAIPSKLRDAIFGLQQGVRFDKRIFANAGSKVGRRHRRHVHPGLAHKAIRAGLRLAKGLDAKASRLRV